MEGVVVDQSGITSLHPDHLLPESSIVEGAVVDQSRITSLHPDHLLPESCTVEGVVVDQSWITSLHPDHLLPEPSIVEGAVVDQSRITSSHPDRLLPESCTVEGVVVDQTWITRFVLTTYCRSRVSWKGGDSPVEDHKLAPSLLTAGVEYREGVVLVSDELLPICITSDSYPLGFSSTDCVCAEGYGYDERLP